MELQGPSFNNSASPAPLLPGRPMSAALNRSLTISAAPAQALPVLSGRPMSAQSPLRQAQNRSLTISAAQAADSATPTETTINDLNTILKQCFVILTAQGNGFDGYTEIKLLDISAQTSTNDLFNILFKTIDKNPKQYFLPEVNETSGGAGDTYLRLVANGRNADLQKKIMFGMHMICALSVIFVLCFEISEDGKLLYVAMKRTNTAMRTFNKSAAQCSNPFSIFTSGVGQKLFCSILSKWNTEISRLGSMSQENLLFSIVTGGTFFAGFVKIFYEYLPIVKFSYNSYMRVVTVLAFIIMHVSLIISNVCITMSGISYSMYNAAMECAMKHIFNRRSEFIDKVNGESQRFEEAAQAAAQAAVGVPDNLDAAIGKLVKHVKGQYKHLVEQGQEANQEELDAALTLLDLRNSGRGRGGARKKPPAKPKTKAPAKTAKTPPAKTAKTPKGIPALPKKRTTTKRA